MRAAARADAGCQALLISLAKVAVTMYRTDAASLRLPYPPSVQQCFDQVVWECLCADERPPGSVAELLAWCSERPLRQWPFDLAAGLVSPAAMLVDPLSKTPTATCAELASQGEEDGLEQEALSSFDACLSNCPEALRPACRELLLQYIVMDASAFYALTRHPRKAQAWDQVAGLYKAAPKDLLVDKKIATCDDCGMLAKPDQGHTFWCETETCGRVSGYTLYEPSSVQVLDYPARTFIAKPGRTEFAVLHRLSEEGFAISAIPSSLDAYRVNGLGSEWVMCVQDRAEPLLHAARIAEIFGTGAERVLIVMAAATLRSRPGYLKAFRGAVPTGLDVTLTSDSRLIRTLKTDARRRGVVFDA